MGMDAPPHGTGFSAIVFTEVAAGFPIPRLLLQMVEKIAAEEKQDIEQRQEKCHAGNKSAEDQGIQIKENIQKSQIFDFHRQQEKQAHLKIRIESGKRQEKGKIQIFIGAIPGDERGENCPHHTAEIKQVKLEFAPLVFQPLTDEAVEIQGKHDPKRRGGRGQKYKSDQPPDFPLENSLPVQGQKGDQIGLRQEQIDQINSQHGGRQDYHQMRNCQPVKFAVQFLKPIHLESSFPENGTISSYRNL